MPAHVAERLRAEFPNYLAPGNPLDAWAVADERVVYPRSLELMAESGAFDILVAQADLSQFRDPGNDEWCELALRALADLGRAEVLPRIAHFFREWPVPVVALEERRAAYRLLGSYDEAARAPYVAQGERSRDSMIRDICRGLRKSAAA